MNDIAAMTKREVSERSDQSTVRTSKFVWLWDFHNIVYIPYSWVCFYQRIFLVLNSLAYVCTSYFYVYKILTAIYSFTYVSRYAACSNADK